MGRTVKCTSATRRVRLRKALQFADAADAVADLGDDVGDAYVTLLVHAGIAAADVLCCARLGEHAVGENHTDAVALLAKVDRKVADDLRTLLGLKTKAGYSHQATSKSDRMRAERATGRLVRAANDLAQG